MESLESTIERCLLEVLGGSLRGIGGLLDEVRDLIRHKDPPFASP
jgi:hypothetical protein